MGYALLADLIVIVHLAYVAFVIAGTVLVLTGALLRWRWIRNPVFRVVHLLAITVVAVQAAVGVICPLTEWETALRRRAGQQVEADISFVGRLVRDVLYYDVSPRALTITYVIFALLVFATLLIVPLRWRRRG
ncbi:MAG: DUF2784 domain-containing protein [Planctomycetes bacterium]|nr:DUF2784 domain-containing protein [Planctomycetota bacterium]